LLSDSQTAPCCVPSFWHNTGVWQTGGQTYRRTDGPTDGIAVASTALAMRALRRAVKNRKSPYLSNGLTDLHEIWHDDACWPSSPFWPLKFQKFKNPRWRRPPSWKKIEKKSPYLRNGWTDRHEIWHSDAVWPSWPFHRLKIRKQELWLGIAYGYGWQGLAGYRWALPRISSSIKLYCYRGTVRSSVSFENLVNLVAWTFITIITQLNKPPRKMAQKRKTLKEPNHIPDSLKTAKSLLKC